MPIEEALEEIFKRYGGGGRSGGQKLLDYREYVELVVEIKRQTGEAWEPASSTRLSTGEAIGVGAALMMVVLTEPLGLTQPTISHHLKVLIDAGILTRDKRGVWAYYALVPGALDAVAAVLTAGP